MAEPKDEMKKTYNHSYVDVLDAARSKGQVLKVVHLPSNRSITVAAFVDSWNDSYTSNWNREQVYGRMDPIQNFQNTQRSISVSFNLVAAFKQEAKRNLHAVSQMVQFLYPSYQNLSDGIMNGYAISGAPVLSVKYMNLISGQGGSALAGTMDGLDHSFDLDAGFFEEASQVYPKVLKLSFTFHPMHQHTQGYLDNISLDDNFPYVNSGYKSDPPESFDVAEDSPDSSGPTPEQQQASANKILKTLDGSGGMYDTLYPQEANQGGSPAGGGSKGGGATGAW